MYYTVDARNTFLSENCTRLTLTGLMYTFRTSWSGSWEMRLNQTRCPINLLLAALNPLLFTWIVISKTGKWLYIQGQFFFTSVCVQLYKFWVCVGKQGHVHTCMNAKWYINLFPHPHIYNAFSNKRWMEQEMWWFLWGYLNVCQLERQQLVTLFPLEPRNDWCVLHLWVKEIQ